jgi:hypothetical protein
MKSYLPTKIESKLFKKISDNYPHEFKEIRKLYDPQEKNHSNRIIKTERKKKENKVKEKEQYWTLVDLIVKCSGYELKNSHYIEKKIEFIRNLLDNAVKRSITLAEIRQKTLNFALTIFGGLFVANYTQFEKPSSIFLSLGLLFIMCTFYLLDRRYHKYIHGWRDTEKIFEKRITEILNGEVEISIPRYVKIGEENAEISEGLAGFYLILVLGSVINLIYTFSIFYNAK